MALSTQTTKVRYVGDGIATYFPIPFPVHNAEHVRVYTSGTGSISEEMTTGFDVFEEDARTYAISFYEPLPAGQDITIARLLPLTQNLDLENGGNFSAEEIETTFDVVVMLIQQLQEELDRAVKTGIAAEESGLSVEEIYAQIETIVRKAEDTLYTIENLVQPVILAKGITNLRGTWTTQDALPAGSLLRLPVGYFPGRNMLALSMDGLECYPVSAHEASGLHQYEEVGGEDEISRDVRLLFDAPAGAVWSAWAIASNVSQHQEDLLTETEVARDRAEAAADKAEQIQGNVDAAIGNAAELAADEAAELAVEKAEQALSALAQAAQSAKTLAESARDEAVGAANKVTADVETTLEQVAQAQASVVEITAFIEQAEALLATVTTARDEAVLSAYKATNAAQTAATNAADNAVKAVRNELTGYLDEAKGVLEAAKVVITGETFHSASGSRDVVAAGEEFAVPSYLVGSGTLQVFLDGLYCAGGEDGNIFQYRELGDAGEVSTAIAWHDDIGPEHEIAVIVNTGKREEG